ncbi:unnamed protein product [Aphanomyces euteiches]|nr:hypothetical protein AeRB84_012207 [Aphanomyces euteiches]
MAWMKTPIKFILSPIEFVFNDVGNTLCRFAVGFGIQGFVHSWLPTALVSSNETLVVVIWYVFAVDEIINPHAPKTDDRCVVTLQWLEFVYKDFFSSLCGIAVGLGIKALLGLWLPMDLVSSFEAFVVVIWYIFAVDEIINPLTQKTDALCVLNLPWLVVLSVILLQGSRRVECQLKQPSTRSNWRRRDATTAGGPIRRAWESCNVEIHRLNEAVTAWTDIAKFVNTYRGQCEAVWSEFSKSSYDAFLEKAWNLSVKLYRIDTLHRICDRESHFNKCGTCADAADGIVYGCRAK